MGNRVGPSNGASPPGDDASVDEGHGKPAEDVAQPTRPYVDPRFAAMPSKAPSVAPPSPQRRAVLPARADGAIARQEALVEAAGRVDDLGGVQRCIGLPRGEGNSIAISNLPRDLQARPLTALAKRLDFVEREQRPEVFAAIVAAIRGLRPAHLDELLKEMAYVAFVLRGRTSGMRDEVMALSYEAWQAGEISTEAHAVVLKELAASQASLMHTDDFREIDKLVSAIKQLPPEQQAEPLANLFGSLMAMQPLAVQVAAFNRALRGLAGLAGEQAERGLLLLTRNIAQFNDPDAIAQASKIVRNASKASPVGVRLEILSELIACGKALAEQSIDEEVTPIVMNASKAIALDATIPPRDKLQMMLDLVDAAREEKRRQLFVQLGGEIPWGVGSVNAE